jgi:integrase
LAAVWLERVAGSLANGIRECHKVRLLSKADAEDALSFKVPKEEHAPVPKGRHLSLEDFRAMLHALDSRGSHATRTRNRALLLALLSTGARRHELRAVQVDEVDLVAGNIWLGRGKGGKARTVFLQPDALTAIHAWVAVRGTEPGPLFVALTRTGGLRDRGLSEHQMWKIIVRAAEQAGVGHVTPHDFRRTLIGMLLDAGVDLSLVSKIAGHARISTTSVYDQRPAATMRAAVNSIRF